MCFFPCFMQDIGKSAAYPGVEGRAVESDLGEQNGQIICCYWQQELYFLQTFLNAAYCSKFKNFKNINHKPLHLLWGPGTQSSFMEIFLFPFFEKLVKKLLQVRLSTRPTPHKTVISFLIGKGFLDH